MSTGKKNMLPEALQNDYEIVGQWPANFEVANLEVKHICWAKMTKNFAEHLISIGWKGLKRKEAVASKTEEPVITEFEQIHEEPLLTDNVAAIEENTTIDQTSDPTITKTKKSSSKSK